MIYLGSDHRGYDLKELIKKEFERNEISYTDFGDEIFNPEDDYPDYAITVGEAVANDPENNPGLLICFSGEGMAIAANKVKGVRAALCHTEESAKLSREHNNANILVLDSKLDLETSVEIINAFFETEFSNEERHIRRIKKIVDYENEHFK